MCYISKSSPVRMILPPSFILSPSPTSSPSVVPSFKPVEVSTSTPTTPYQHHYSSLLESYIRSSAMAPVLVRRVLDSPIWSTLDASQPTFSRRDIDNGNSTPLFIIPIAIFIFLVTIGCCIKVHRLNNAKQRNEAMDVSQRRDLGVPRRTGQLQAASMPPPVSDDILDPPPPYVPLQTLKPAHKPVDDTLQRPADNERTGESHGQVRSMLDV